MASDKTKATPNRQSQFFNYPESQKWPSTRYEPKNPPTPVLGGMVLVVAAFLMEMLRPLQKIIWHTAGFGSLRKILPEIEGSAPWYEPTIVPREEVDAQTEQALPETSGATAPEPAENPIYYSVADYHALYLSGKVTPTDVALALLPLIRRGEKKGESGKYADAWIYSREDLVLQAAEESTIRYKEGRPLGILDGVPTGVKDDYDVAGYPTNLGTGDVYSNIAGDDQSTSWSAQKLIDAGAVVLGKCSMHEFGLDTTGNNPKCGTPLNPYNTKYYPGGSSSGPASAVGTGLIPIALGSDGGGSIRIPASFCSVFGLKPTHARVALWPGINHSPTCEVHGPLAADMRSLEALYKTVAQPHSSTRFPPLALQPAPPAPKFLGVYRKWIARSHPGVQELFNSSIERLTSKHGYSVVDIEIPYPSEGQMAHALTILTDASTLLRDPSVATPANRILLSLGRTSPSTDYLLCQKLRGLLMRHLAYLFETHPGMVILTPTTACPGAPIRGGRGELKFGLNDSNMTLDSMAYVWLANFCGLPAISVPAGYLVPEGQKNAGSVADKDTVGAVPIGLMAAGEWCSEDALIKFGYDAEAANGELRRKPPVWEDAIALAKARLNGATGGREDSTSCLVES